jgi:hypothetical protein
VDDGVIDGQPEEDGRETHTDDINAGENQAAQSQSGSQDEGQQGQEPKHWFEAAMCEPKEGRNYNGGAANGEFDIVLHSAGDFGDESWAPGKGERGFVQTSENIVRRILRSIRPLKR